MLLPCPDKQCINKHVESLRRICLDQGSIPCSSTFSSSRHIESYKTSVYSFFVFSKYSNHSILSLKKRVIRSVKIGHYLTPDFCFELLFMLWFILLFFLNMSASISIAKGAVIPQGKPRNSNFSE